MTKKSPRKRPSQDRSKATVDALMTATAQLLVELGYAKTSTNRIAKRAGVSIGSLYQYFPNKDVLILELLKRHVDTQHKMLEMRLLEVMTSGGDEEEDMARALVIELIRIRQHQPELSRVLFEQIPRTGNYDLVTQWTDRAVELLHMALVARRDLVRPKNLEMAAYVLVHAFSGVFNYATLSRPDMLQDDALVDEVVDLIMCYLRVSSPPSES